MNLQSILEPSVLSIITTTLFVGASPAILVYYKRQPVCVKSSRLAWIKSVYFPSCKIMVREMLIDIFQLFTTLLLAERLYSLQLLLAAAPFVSLSSAILSTLLSLEALGIHTVVYTQHFREIRPSAVTSLYLAVGIAVEFTIEQTLHDPTSHPLSCLHFLPVAIKAVVLLLHEQSKWSQLQEHIKVRTEPDTTRGLLSRILVNLSPSTYMNDGLKIDDFNNLGPDFDIETLLTNFDPIWTRCNASYINYPLNHIILILL